MKEETIAVFMQKDTILQLLKITKTNVNGYFQIRDNKKVIATIRMQDTAIRKFYGIIGNKILQKDIFSNQVKEISPA